MGLKWDQDELEKMWRKVDRNRDGRISFEEWQVRTARCRHSRGDVPLTRAAGHAADVSRRPERGRLQLGLKTAFCSRSEQRSVYSALAASWYGAGRCCFATADLPPRVFSLLICHPLSRGIFPQTMFEPGLSTANFPRQVIRCC